MYLPFEIISLIMSCLFPTERARMAKKPIRPVEPLTLHQVGFLQFPFSGETVKRNGMSIHQRHHVLTDGNKV